ncbi:Transcriptional regulatory protein MucR [uncultured Gammaproteobacteria bacterium]
MSSETDQNKNLVQLTATVVSAYVVKNAVAVPNLAELIASVYNSLRRARMTETTPEPQPAQAPAVPVRKSIQPDSVTCLDCGKKFKMLKRHIMTDHGLTTGDYRVKWSLPAEYPMVAPNYAQQRSELAVKIGLGRGPRK